MPDCFGNEEIARLWVVQNVPMEKEDSYAADNDVPEDVDELDAKPGGENAFGRRFESATRTVICDDAISWLNSYEDNGLPEGYCGFTSLPDITELAHSFKIGTDEYKQWFIDAAALFMSKLQVGSYIIFLQSDVRYLAPTGEIDQWIDKSYLCSVAAERTGCVLMWHKLVMTDKNNTKKSTGRPTYSHLVCYGKNGWVHRVVETKVTRNQRKRNIHAEKKQRMKAKQEQAGGHEGDESQESVEAAGASLSSALNDMALTAVGCGPSADPSGGAVPAPLPEAQPSTAATTTTAAEAEAEAAPVRSYLRCGYRTSLFAVPDIFYRGDMLWPKGIGLDCCFVGVAFLKTVACAKGVVDPFAGQGTVLAMADALGLPSIGVEISPKRCRKAHNLRIDLELVTPYLRKLALDVVEERQQAATAAVAQAAAAVEGGNQGGGDGGSRGREEGDVATAAT